MMILKIFYRSTSVLPCFSKIPKLIMYNRLHHYLNDGRILYTKQFSFQAEYATEHALVKLTDQTHG